MFKALSNRRKAYSISLLTVMPFTLPSNSFDCVHFVEKPMTTEYIGNELGATPIVNPAKATIANPDKVNTEI